MTKDEIKKKFNKKTIIVPHFVNKLLITIFFSLLTIIILKSNTQYKQLFYEKVYTDTINFASINKMYERYFGSSIPFKDYLTPTKTVFNEKLKYSKIEKYMDGAKLEVDTNYLVPSLDSGIVIFIGEKENYGKTVIILNENDIEVWYGNLNNININMYDYIEQGSFLGEVNNNLYLLFMKEGKIVDYENYI